MDDGFSIVRIADSAEVGRYGSVPSYFSVTEASIDVHCPVVGINYSGYMLVPRQIAGTAPAAWYQVSGSTIAFDGAMVTETLAFALSTVAARKAIMSGLVNSKRDVILSGGYTVPSAISVALAGKVLQTAEADDKINWLTSKSSYKDAIDAGQGSAVGATFRTADNSEATVSFSEAYSVLQQMAQWGANVYQNSWTLKNSIVAAADHTALDGIDINSGWPA